MKSDHEKKPSSMVRLSGSWRKLALSENHHKINLIAGEYRLLNESVVTLYEALLTPPR